MWDSLACGQLAEECLSREGMFEPLGLGPSVRKLAGVLFELKDRPYAEMVFGHWSHAVLHLGFSSRYLPDGPRWEHSVIIIEPTPSAFWVGWPRESSFDWNPDPSDASSVWETLDVEELIRRSDSVLKAELAKKEDFRSNRGVSGA